MSVIYIIALLVLLISIYYYKKKSLAVICLIFLYLLGAMRGIEVGTDTLGYADDYNFIIQVRDGNYILHTFEKGFIVLIYLFKKYVTHEYLPFVTFMFTVFFAGVMRLLSYTKVPYALGLYFLFTLGFYFGAYNVMRQMMAIGIILLFVNVFTALKTFPNEPLPNKSNTLYFFEGLSL